MKLIISTTLTLFAVAVAPIASILCTTCNALAPPKHSSPVSTSSSTRKMNINESSPSTFTNNDAFQTTRRSATFSIISSIFAIPSLAHAASENSLESEPQELSEAEKAEAAKERMRQRIADSKKSYRKPTDLVMTRKDSTDYSCVAETGSPCPEGLVPRAVQREIVGALEKLESK
mmetsp:Transcript_8773/g.13186  ORF Transcript_8773/g.13186 Transcript_8773/m.13186 type:complete len:175 (-) Transcript_8773:224-748(-)